MPHAFEVTSVPEAPAPVVVPAGEPGDGGMPLGAAGLPNCSKSNRGTRNAKHEPPIQGGFGAIMMRSENTRADRL